METDFAFLTCLFVDEYVAAPVASNACCDMYSPCVWWNKTDSRGKVQYMCILCLRHFAAVFADFVCLIFLLLCIGGKV